MVKISITTPSIRPEFMGIVASCVKKQDFTDFEWLIGTRPELIDDMKVVIGDDSRFRVLPEPPKKEEDFYALNQCWNMLFREAKGDLIINIVDGLWFPNDVLSSLWLIFQQQPRIIVSLIGNQYEENGYNKPEVLTWIDPRNAEKKYGSFWEVNPVDIEWCLVSIPRQVLLDIGGIDETYSQGAAVSEKEANLRMDKLEYKFFLSSSPQYRAFHNERLGGEDVWNKKYEIACALLKKHIHEINEGRRLKLDFLK